MTIEKLQDKIWSIIGEISGGLLSYFGNDLVSFFVAGSTYHGEIKYNQDVDLFIVVKNKLPGEDYQKMQEDLQGSKRGNLIGATPATPWEIKKIFKQITDKYSDESVDVVVKFTIGPYFLEPSEKPTIHLHTIGPMSLDFFKWFSEYSPLHSLTSYNNVRVMNGKHPMDLVDIKATLEDLIKWLKLSEIRLNKSKELLKESTAQAALLASKSVISACLNVLAYKGEYENRSEQAASLFFKIIPIKSSELPKEANILKKSANSPSLVSEDVNNFIERGLKFMEEIYFLFNIPKNKL